MAAIVPLLRTLPYPLRRWLQADLEAERVRVAVITIFLRRRSAELLLRRVMTAWIYKDMPELVSSSDENVGHGSVDPYTSSSSGSDDDGSSGSDDDANNVSVDPYVHLQLFQRFRRLYLSELRERPVGAYPWV